MATNGARAVASFVIVFFFISHTYAQDRCTAGCQGAQQPKDGFTQGNTYTYSLEGLANIQLSGADKQQTTVKLTAQATVVALGNCANLLKVTNLEITGNDGAKYGKPRDIDKPVRFTLQDGVLGSEICSEDGDSQRSLNIKRALLSLLQTATKHNTEVDIFGVCPTTFSVNKEGTNVIVRKSKDLNFCAHREQAKQDLLTYIYNPNSEIKDSQILQSNLRVDASVKNGIVEKVEATEDYLYRPFSVGQQGVKGSIVTKLTLRNTNKGTLPAKCVDPKSIIFENPHLVNTEHSNVANLLLALNSATNSVQSGVQEKSASIFAGLIRVFRVSNKADILNVYEQIKRGSAVKDNNLAKKVFLDALFRTGTGDSVEASIDILQKKELTPFQARLVLLSLSTVRHASSSSLKAATVLLDSTEFPNDVFLGVGALAGAYCHEHRCHGSPSDPGVAAVTNKLISKMGDCKAASKKAEDLILYVLKGIKNIHHLEDSVVDKLANCASNKNVRQRVRVAALETFSADACIPKLKQTALTILKDRQQDSEVRIKAYLALLDCPDAKIAGELKSLLDTETINQVGSFITSSIRNIKASTNPSRQTAKELFSPIKLKKFPLDARKYSQNYEFSFEADTVGVGSAVEANIIFSQDSFLPRSANLNLTAEIFGREINLIEFGIRQGNLDRVIEEYFGPHGTIKTQTPQESFKSVQRTTTSILDKIHQRLKGTRSKRDVQKQITDFGNKLKSDIQGYHGSLDIDVFLKLFGTENVFLSLGDDTTTSIESLIDRIFNFIDSGISDAKQFSHELRSHILFLDMELAYPSATGLTLKLNLEGAATTKLTFGGNLDVQKLFKDPKNAKVEIKVIPSANIKVSGTLSIDADVVVHGIKVVATLHTSTGTHLIVKTTENSFDIQWGLPVDKQELITATNEIFFYKREKGHQDEEKVVTFDPSNYSKKSACFDQLSAAVGLIFCGDLSGPWEDVTAKGKTSVVLGPTFPLSGPARFSLSLEKDQLSGFHVHGSQTSKLGSRHLELVLEAQGSKKERKLTLTLDGTNLPELRSVKAVVKVAQKHFEVYAGIVNNDAEKLIAAKAVLDQETPFNFKLGVVKLSGISYKPVLEFNLGNTQNSAVVTDGTIDIQTTPKTKSFVFKDLSLAISQNTYTLNGMIEQKDKSFQTNLKLANQQHNAEFSAKLSEDGPALKILSQFKNNINPSVDFNLKLERITKTEFKSMDFSLIHGDNPSSKENKITYFATLKLKPDNTDYLSYSQKFEYPLYKLNHAIKVDKEVNSFEAEAKGQYSASNFVLELDLVKDKKKEGDLFAKFEAKVNNKGVETEFQYDAEDESKGKFAAKLKTNPGPKYEVSGQVKFHITAEETDSWLKAKFKTSAEKSEYKIDVGVGNNPSNYNSHLKLSVDSTDYLESVVKLQKEPTAGGTLKIIVKDLLDAQGQYKVNPDNKRNAVLLIDFIKVGRKVKVDSTFFGGDHQCNLAVDVFPNFEKDNSNKLSFISNNKHQDRTVDSKNTLIINKDKTELHYQREAEGDDDNGKYSGLFDLQRTNTGQSVNLKWSRDITTKDGDIKAEAQVNFAYLPAKGKQPTKLDYTGKILSLNTNTGQADTLGHLHFVRNDGQDLDVQVAVKIVPKNHRKNVDVKLEMSGSLNKENVVVSSNFDYLEDSTEKLDTKYRLKANYGQKATVDLSGNVNGVLPDHGDSKLNSHIELQLTSPLDQARNVKLSSTDSLVVFEDVDKLFAVTSQQKIQVNSEAYAYDANLQFGRHDGKVKLSAVIPSKKDPFVFETNYKAQDDGDNTRKYHSNLNLEYGSAGQHLQVEVDAVRQLDKEGQLTISAVLPDNEKAKKIVVSIKTKKLSPQSFTTDVDVDVDGKKYSASSEFEFTRDSGLVDFKATCPEGKQARIFAKGHGTGDNSFKAETKLENLGDLSLDMTLDAKLISHDNFNIKINADSQKLKLNKIKMEVKSDQAGKGTNKIVYSAKEAGKNLLSGSTTYQSRQEGSKFIMEGSGNVKIREENKATSFKFIKDRLTETPQETGVEVFFNVAFGEKNVVIEHKVTNQEYKLSSVYCEEKKQCAHININNKLDTSVPSRLSHKLEFELDLRKLGFAPEFGLHSASELERFKLPIHSLDIHISQDKSKYHAQAYAKLVKGAYLTAATLTTPQRVISLESSTTVPDYKAKSLTPIRHETVFFPNKNEPSSKSLLRVNADFQRVEQKQVSASGELTISSPPLGKDIQVTGKSQYDITTHAVSSELVLDIFKKKNQKVVVTFNYAPEIKQNKDILNSQLSYVTDFDINGKAIGFSFHLGEKFFLNRDQLKFSYVATATNDKQQKTAAVNLEISPSKQFLQLKLPNHEILRLEGVTKLDQSFFKGELTGTILQDKAYKLASEVTFTSPYTLTASAGAMGDPARVVISSKLLPFKSIDLKAEHITGKQTRLIARLLLGSQEKSDKPEITVKTDMIKEIVTSARANLVEVVKKAEQVLKSENEAIVKDAQKLKTLLQAACPDYQGLSTAYQNGIQKLAEELKSDKVLQQFSNTIQSVLKSVNKVLTDLIERLREVSESSQKVLSELLERVNQIWNESFLPSITKLVETGSHVALQLLGGTLDVVSHYLVLLSELVEKHSAELKPFIERVAKNVEGCPVPAGNAIGCPVPAGNAIGCPVPAGNEIYRVIEKEVATIVDTVRGLGQEAINYFKEIPLTKLIKEKMIEYDVLNTIERCITFVLSGLAELGPQTDAQERIEFFKALNIYLNKKLENKETNDFEELNALGTKLLAALDKLLTVLRDIISKRTVDVTPGGVQFPLDAPKISRLPAFILPRFSVLNFFNEESNIDAEDVIRAYWPRSANPMDLIPPTKLRALVAGGQHIFTFDDRHMTFPGSCRYVLAQDAVDGNFSIIINLEKGSAKSITLWDKSGNTVEVNDKAQLTLNGQNHGFPVIKADTIAWKDSRVLALTTKYGAEVKCFLNLDLCYVEVSGFYHGKLRGLLGDGNNEPFDDFRLPNGKISTSESEFGNAYALSPNCASVQTVDHSDIHSHSAHADHGHGGHKAKSSPICNKLFGDKSSLSLCDISVDIKNFRQACQHATAGGGPKADHDACLIAKAYTVACHASSIYLPLPDQCATCKVGDTVYQQGQEFDVKSPQKQADIVLVVETTKANEKTYKELVVPLLSALVDELKAKKIDDVKVQLVGISPNLRYPIYYDTDNAKLGGAKIDFKDQQRSAKWESPIATEDKKVDDYLNRVARTLQVAVNELAIDNLHISYSLLGAKMIWRPKAIKTILMVHSEACTEATFPVFQFIGSTISEALMEEAGIVAHLIAPVEGIEFSKKGKNPAHVVGFSQTDVFILGDKKRGLSNTAVRDSLEFDDDQCSEYPEETFGNTYSSTTFFGLNPNQRKGFITMASNTLVDSLVAVNIESECSCQSNFFYPQVKCEVKNRKDNRKAGSKK